MKFIDEVKIHIQSGKGGDGCCSFRRERFVPFGGPDGGDGGRGGDVILLATRQKNTLQELRGRSIWKARSGQPGGPRKCTGASAQSIVITVPVGTRIYNANNNTQLIDLTEDGQRWIACQGGRGGLGNTHFKSSTNQAPRKTTQGKPNEEKHLRLELMLMADVGLLGYPNAGKSTLISCMSAAKPKIASYPFTTLKPSLGVVAMGYDGTFVMADIPGLIQGAAQGHGLGHQFLRHVRRSRILLHMLSLCPTEELSIVERYRIIRSELEHFDESLISRPELIAFTKADLLSPEEAQEQMELFKVHFPNSSPYLISSAQRRGLKELRYALWSQLQEL